MPFLGAWTTFLYNHAVAATIHIDTTRHLLDNTKPHIYKQIIDNKHEIKSVNVIMVDKNFVSFHQYLRYCYIHSTLVVNIPSAII